MLAASKMSRYQFFPGLVPNIADCLHDLGPGQCFKHSSPDCCLLISVAPEMLAHLSHKFRPTEEDSILDFPLPVRLPTSNCCRVPQLLTKRLLELALRAWTEERQDGLGA